MAATAMTSGEEPPSDEALDASFLLLQLLGKGSYGSVYMGQARDTGQLFAIKVITLAEGDEGYSEIRHEIQMLQARESDAQLAALGRQLSVQLSLPAWRAQECTHPNVVRYFGSLLGRSYLWIVMEFCGGGSIRDVLNARGTALTEEAIAVVCREALKGLAYLHGISKVHRDIKCSNILLTVSGQVKLADFGVSAQLTRTMSKRNTFIGTPHWMAPEVIQESRYDGKVDVWALGISVMEMAEFQPPRHAIHPMRVIFMISREPPPQLAQAEAWSSAMHSFVAACLQKNARQRPSAAQLLNHSFVKQATAATTCLADEVERTAEWLAAQRSAAADAEGHTGGSTPVAGSAASTGGAAVKVGPLPGAPAATSPLRGADATVSSAGTFVVHDSWDGGAGAAARREGVQAAVAGSETGGTVSTTTSGPGGSTGRASWAAPAAVAVHGAGGGGPVSAPPQGGTQGKGKAPPKAAPAKAAAAAPSGGSSHRSRSRSGERGAVGLTYGTQAAEEAVRQWMEDAWSGLDASAAERILASADGACLPFLRACDVPPLALIQADTHGDLAVDVDQEAMAHLAQACACTGAEGTPHPALPDSTQAMLRACPPLLNVARAAAFHAAAAAAAPAVGPARQAHAAAESGLVETLRTVMHL